MKQQSVTDRFEIGQMVQSRQGRDKNHFYVIVRKDQRFVYCADGSKWTFENPKKKNPIHVQIIHSEVDTTDIVRAIRTFENRNGIEEDK